MKLKRLGLVFMVLVVTITTTACSSTKPTNSSNGTNSSSAITSPQPGNENNPSTSPQATPSPTVKPSTSAQPSSSPVEGAKFYFGTWIIKKYMPTTNISSLSTKDINGYIGQKIIFNKNQIVTDNGTIKNPIFKEKTLTNTDFFDDWRVQFSGLGIIGNTVTQVEVSNYKNETGNGIGSELIFTINNKTYTNIGSCFFELEK